jgi:hypothetical protein
VCVYIYIYIWQQYKCKCKSLHIHKFKMLYIQLLTLLHQTLIQTSVVLDSFHFLWKLLVPFFVRVICLSCLWGQSHPILENCPTLVLHRFGLVQMNVVWFLISIYFFIESLVQSWDQFFEFQNPLVLVVFTKKKFKWVWSKTRSPFVSITHN